MEDTSNDSGKVSKGAVTVKSSELRVQCLHLGRDLG